MNESGPPGRPASATASARRAWPLCPGRRSAMARLAARVAGQRALASRDRDRAERMRAELKAALGGLKGPLMKVAQILATIPDALPAEYAAELAQLQANAPPMGWPFVRRRMAARARGRTGRAEFASFEHEAAAAASLGQVHRATAARRRGARLQAAISRHASRRWRPTSRQLQLMLGDLSTACDRAIDTERDPQGDRRPAARGAGLRARGRAHARSTRRCWRTSPHVHVPDAAARAVDPPPADHDLARRPAAAQACRGRRRRRRATASRMRCSAPGTCRSTATA